jgi:hypothetical protein
MTILVDTLAAKKPLLQGGFNEAQAETIVHLFSDAEKQIATKHDVELLRRDLELLRRDLTLKIAIANIGTVIATVTILRFLLGTPVYRVTHRFKTCPKTV